MGITELDKPPGVWCKHCSPGHGCKIYGEHPASCQGFACLWLVAPQVPENCRPDKSKVVLVADADGIRLIAHCHPADPFAWQREPIYSLLKRKASATWGTGVNVLAKAGTDHWLLTPVSDFNIGRIDPRSPYRIQVLPDGDAILSILPPTLEAIDLQPVTRVLTRRQPNVI